MWACPRCHVELSPESSDSVDKTYPLQVEGWIVHQSASLERYASVCPSCGLPYTADGVRRFEYPYRQLLANEYPRKFLSWSAAQNNGYISYSLMRGSSCSVQGRDDAQEFSEFIRRCLPSDTSVVLDFGCGPLPRPSYLPNIGDATLIGLDPFHSEWSGRFIHGAGEFLPIRDGTVDLVVAATSLDHTLDYFRALRELARVTRCGGSLVVWDHTLETRRKRATTRVQGLAAGLLFADMGRIRQAILPERLRIYDNGIVLWTPKRYADPFHEPRSRRMSWQRRLRIAAERAGFMHNSTLPEMGFSHFVRD